MAQVLKEEVRESILKNAKEELLEQGFENASMRRIAGRSRMTVGNLYRYFKSKDEINDTIVSPTYELINSLVRKLTHGQLSLSDENGILNASLEELKDMFRSLSSGLVDIYKDHRAEVNILMMGSKLNKELTRWFAAVIASLIEKSYPVEKGDPTVAVLSKCYADAIFGGIRTILRSAEDYDDSLKTTVMIYLNSYLSLLGQDISVLI